MASFVLFIPSRVEAVGAKYVVQKIEDEKMHLMAIANMFVFSGIRKHFKNFKVAEHSFGSL